MKTYPTFYLVALLAVACSTEVFSQTGIGTSSSTANLELLLDGKRGYSDKFGSGMSITADNLILNSYSDDNNLVLDPIQVFSQAGICVNDKVVIKILSTSQLEIDFSKLPSGIYLVETKDGSLMVAKK